MRSYLMLFTFSLLFTLGLTPVVRRWALRRGAVDLPDGQRRIHKVPTPRLGGVAIYLSFLATLSCAPWLGNLVSRNLLDNWRTVAVVMAAATLVFALGVYDDFRGSSAPVKILVQLIAAAILYNCDLRISVLSSPWGGSWELPLWLSFPLTALWIVGITNAFNLIDGIDGLAAGASAFALLSLFVCSMMQGHPEVSLLSIVLIGATLGFLRYNFNPATIFLGDSGSLLLGFMAASLSLVSAQKSATLVAIAIPLVSFGLPVAEVWLSLGRRLLSGAPLFKGDRRHIHHMLLQRGLNQRQAAILLYGICALFSLFGLMLLNPQRNAIALILFVLGVGAVLGVHHLRYAEFGALGHHLKQGVVRRRRALAVSVCAQRASADLRHAQNIEQLLETLVEWCRAQNFDGVSLELKHSWQDWSDLPGPAGKFVITPGRGDVAWVWKWPGDDDSLVDVSASSGFWSVRVPLAGKDAVALGAITCYGDISKPTADLAQIRDVLREDLSAALVRLRRQHCLALQPSGGRLPVMQELTDRP